MTEQLERWQIIDQNFHSRLLNDDLQDLDINSILPPSFALESVIKKTDFINLITAQFYTRHIDLQARSLKQRNLGFYSIASAGHENNIALAYCTELKDTALLHYRSSAFMLGRAAKLSCEAIEQQIINQIRSIFASKYDAIAGGRHKVLGSVELNVPPQTSTIASQLPKALGLALSINQNKLLKNNNNDFMTSDSIVLCSFGDASFNHSTAQGALNSAKILTYKNVPLPLIYVCEDNNIGISVKTPSFWIESNFPNNHLYYIQADGRHLLDTLIKTQHAVHIARNQKKPVFLHIKTIRLMGHAGSDIEQNYLSLEEIVANERHDPLLYSAKIALDFNLLTKHELINLYEQCRQTVAQYTEKVMNEPKLESSTEIMSSIIPKARSIDSDFKIDYILLTTAFDKIMPTWRQPRNMGQSINLCLAETLLKYKNTIIYGEDVGRNGGVYRATNNLQNHFGQKRVFDTVLDEQTILGTAIGYGQNNIIPIVEIQFLAYIHNALDQLRSEAATLPFFSCGNLANPMLIRLPGFAYQKGFGGHFHNDNSIAALRDIPGLLIATPSSAISAVKLLRTLIKECYVNNRVCIFIEPIALYFIKNLYTDNDNLLLAQYENIEGDIKLGEISVESFHNKKRIAKKQLIIISYANGYILSLQAAKKLMEENLIEGLEINVIDLNWLKPLPIANLLNFLLKLYTAYKSASFTILIVDECRKTGSLSEELTTELYNYLRDQSLLLLFKIHVVTGLDSFIPLGPAAYHVLPSAEGIIKKVINIFKD